MGKVKKSTATIIIISIIALSACFFFLYREKLNENPEQEQDSSTSEISFYIDAQSPPALSGHLREIFNAHQWVETTSDEKAGILVAPPQNTENAAAEAITIYQIWVIAQKFHKQATPPGTNISTISDRIDSDDPSTLLADKFSTPVSQETTSPIGTASDGGSLTLTTLQDVDSSLYVISIDNLDPLTGSTWESSAYPLISQTTISAPKEILASISDELDSGTFLSEHDYLMELPESSSFVSIIKTGTSVSGGPGWELCERSKGRADYPIDAVKDVLSKADLTIISNEASFVENCVQPAGTTSFCGKPHYIQNLLDIGTDIISLTGNHMCDYGKTSFQSMLNTYTESGVEYFGGGENISSAWKPLLVSTSAGTIAFIGFNNMGPNGVLATESLPGAAPYDAETLRSAITNAQDTADIVWVDTHLWPEYLENSPDPNQLAISREAVDAGADIVTGVSSHAIQGMEFYSNTPVFLGLGNFLFDQMWSDDTREGLVLDITLYDGMIRRISLLPTTMYDYCQPRFQEGEEKNDTITDFFERSVF